MPSGAMPRQRRTIRGDRIGGSRQSHARGAEPDPFLLKDRAATPISTPRWRATTPKARPTPCAVFKARGLDLHADGCDPESADTGADHLRRRGRQLHRALDFLKKHFARAGLTFFPKSGHVLNLEEPALFNEMVERFIALVEAGDGRAGSEVDGLIVIASEAKQSIARHNG